MADYLEDIKKIISYQFGIPQENIEEESSLEKDLNITDLEIEDLVFAIEAKYQIKIPPETVTTFKKVSDLTTYLYENIGSQS